jgi:hypothetical protein
MFLSMRAGERQKTILRLSLSIFAKEYSIHSRKNARHCVFRQMNPKGPKRTAKAAKREEAAYHSSGREL